MIVLLEGQLRKEDIKEDTTLTGITCNVLMSCEEFRHIYGDNSISNLMYMQDELSRIARNAIHNHLQQKMSRET